MDYVLLGDFLDADQWFTKALKMNPADADGWYYLGRTKYNENRFSEAIDAFHTCLKLDAHNVKAEDNLGLSYEGVLNQIEEATQAFRTAIAWQTGGGERDAQPYINMGMLLLDQEHPEATWLTLQEVVLAPQNPKAHEQLGRAYLKLKRWNDAHNELEKAVQLAPNSSSLHYELAMSYRDQGLKEEAKKEFDRCTELNATHSSVETPNPWAMPGRASLGRKRFFGVAFRWLNHNGWASPIDFGPRIPDFLSRLAALSNFMRLSLRESRTRGRG